MSDVRSSKIQEKLAHLKHSNLVWHYTWPHGNATTMREAFIQLRTDYYLDEKYTIPKLGCRTLRLYTQMASF